MFSNYNFTYKKTKDEYTVIRKEDNAFIPKDINNTDYQIYLEWVKAGNTPEEAD
tara:strand:+ start:624 stop:785 length:162 start_codon:yes stop_codon:yes gene_type:complete